MKKKSEITVEKATRFAFLTSGRTFHSYKLCNAVKEITGRPNLMDGTITRRLREIREKEPEIFNYRCIDNVEGIYEKINPDGWKKEKV